MAKKSRKSRSQQLPRLSPSQLVQPAAGKVAPVVPTVDDSVPDLEHEYRYVINDLKYIAIIAAVMLALMIIAAVIFV
ncbi:MAG: hypothetical protein JW900_08540 [Anaerolineae bacterium]|nr:hypothetical protein [Anaerolineae bacterium]